LDEIEDIEYFKKINIEEKYGEKFDEEKVTKESFICLMDKVLQYSPENNPNNKCKLIESSLKKFRQEYTIYSNIFEKYKEDKEIQKQLAISSINILELKALINLIKLFKDETIRLTFFENIGDKTIIYEDFINIEETDNLKMLIELLNNNLVAESTYLRNNID
jgi:hypothetical protein